MKEQNNIKPYLMLAFYTWAIDSNVVPLLEVRPHEQNVIPEELKNKSKIIFSIHPKSVQNLIFGKKFIEFQARFQGTPFQVSICHEAISKIFNKDTGNGLEFNETIEVNQLETANEIEENSPIDKPAKLSDKNPIRKNRLILIKKEK